VTEAKIAASAVTGAKIAQDGATSGQALKWNGTAWAPGNDELGGLTLPFEGTALTTLQGSSALKVPIREMQLVVRQSPDMQQQHRVLQGGLLAGRILLTAEGFRDMHPAKPVEIMGLLVLPIPLMEVQPEFMAVPAQLPEQLLLLWVGTCPLWGQGFMVMRAPLLVQIMEFGVYLLQPRVQVYKVRQVHHRAQPMVLPVVLLPPLVQGFLVQQVLHPAILTVFLVRHFPKWPCGGCKICIINRNHLRGTFPGTVAAGFSGYFTGGKFYVSGNVGIGTETPEYRLDVYAPTNRFNQE
jgi:hypothetical protein